MSDTQPRREPVEIRSAQVGEVDFEQRTIELIAVPYDQETEGPVRGPDGKLMRELIERGAFDGIETRSEHVTANRDHDYSRTIGKVMDYRADDPRGLVAVIRVSDTPLGDESLRLAADDVLKASVGMLVRRMDQRVKNGLRRVKRAFLDHVALVPNPAYSGANVLAVRQEQPGEPADEPDTPNLDAVFELLDD